MNQAMKINKISKQDSTLKYSMPIEVPDDESDVYWQAVEESDSDRLHKMHDKLKDQGQNYWLEWTEFVEDRVKMAADKIAEKKKLVQRVRNLTHSSRNKNAEAISELSECVKSDENPNGLIPVALSEFV